MIKWIKTLFNRRAPIECEIVEDLGDTGRFILYRGGRRAGRMLVECAGDLARITITTRRRVPAHIMAFFIVGLREYLQTHGGVTKFETIFHKE